MTARHYAPRDRTSPICGQSGFALMLTPFLDEVTCKRCLRWSLNQRAAELGMRWGTINAEGEKGWVRP